LIRTVLDKSDTARTVRSTGQWGAALLGSGILLVAGIKLVPPVLLVAARSLMFSTFVADDSISQHQLNDSLAARGLAAEPREYRRLIEPQRFSALSEFARHHAGDGTALAREILLSMSPGRSIGGCGAESLGEKVAGAARRYGCCSEYTAAFLVYAGALGLPARRVENQIHTTAEYFDRNAGNWVWVDPMYRAQATDGTGRLLSHFEIRERILEHKAVRITEMLDPPMAPDTYQALYGEAQYAIGYWYPQTDLMAIENFDARLRTFHIPLPIRQLVALCFGVRAEPTGVASPADVSRLRLEAWLAWSTLALLGVMELSIAFVFATRCVKLLRGRPTRRASGFATPQFAESEDSK
jgi:hypothetical protein